MNLIHVLLKLWPGYGLGDSVQTTAVIRHLKKYRPNWIIDFQSDKPDCMLGLVRNAFTYSEPRPQAVYDIETDIVLYDTFCAFTDRPNTRVTSCLHEKFGMEWDREFAKYEINITPQANYDALELLISLRIPSFAQCHLMEANDRYPLGTPMQQGPNGKYYPSRHKAVCIQYEGDSSPTQKNLAHEQALEICNAVVRLGRKPLLIDWRGKSILRGGACIHATPSDRPDWGSSAQMNAAIISQCEAFIGIDSGPGKCASSTETPTLICWTGHHPALFHDPADNTTHLVPVMHRQNPLLQGNVAVADWFEDNYNWKTYAPAYKSDESSLVENVKCWMENVLK